MLVLAALILLVILYGSKLEYRAVQAKLPKRFANKDTLMNSALFREQITGQVDLAAFKRGDITAPIVSNAFNLSSIIKRILDVVCAASLLLLMAPLLLLTSIAIMIDSKGPVFYCQKRTGLNGRLFNIIKFRSMVCDAEKDGARWAAANDDRVTSVGRIIRKLRIDEIPQALNVLRGEMSFVGPRPERPEFVELLEKEIPNYNLRHIVKPGITGWAQVKYVYGASVEDAREKLKYDLFYVKHFSIARDILIVFMTVRVALFGVGSR